MAERRFSVAMNKARASTVSKSAALENTAREVNLGCLKIARAYWYVIRDATPAVAPAIIPLIKLGKSTLF